MDIEEEGGGERGEWRALFAFCFTKHYNIFHLADKINWLAQQKVHNTSLLHQYLLYTYTTRKTQVINDLCPIIYHSSC